MRNETKRFCFPGLPVLRATVCAVLAVAGLSGPASGSYWGASGEKFSEKAEMSYMDVRYPFFTSASYYSFCHHWICSTAQGNDAKFGMYAGTAYNNFGVKDRDPALNTTLQWSAWHSSKGGAFEARYAFPGCNRSHVLGEGAACGAGGVYPIKAERWYRHVFRFWSSDDPERAKVSTYMGWWTRDLEADGEWMLVNVIELPIPKARFMDLGLGGFVELFGPADRTPPIQTQSFRNLYTYKEGVWDSATRFILPEPAHQKLELSENDSVVTLKTSTGGPFEDVKGPVAKVTKTIKQPDEPDLGELKAPSVRAWQVGGQVLVEWSAAKGSVPLMKWSLDLLGENGEPVRSELGDLPSVNSLLLDVPEGSKVASVRLRATCIFNRQTEASAKVGVIDEDRRIAPSPVGNTEIGVMIAFHEKQGAVPSPDPAKPFTNFDRVPDMSAMPVTRRVIQRQPSLDSIPRDFGIAARMNSYLRIPRSGIYRLHLTACPGGRLLVGGKTFVSQDIHGSGNEVSNWAYFAEGLHEVAVESYVDTAGGTAFLKPRVEVEYEGPGIPRQRVPDGEWLLKEGTKPRVTWEAKASTGEGRDSNVVTLTLGEFSGDASLLDKVEVMTGNSEVWLTMKPEDTPGEHRLFLPEAEHLLHLRLHYKDGTLLDLPEFKLAVKNPAIEGWTMADPGNAQRPFGIAATPDRIVMMGDGSRWATRRVEGDFTIEMRMKEFGNAVIAAPMGNDPRAHFGFYAQPETVSQFAYGRGFNWYKSMYYGGRFDTPSRHDAGLNQVNWQKSYHEVPAPSCWFRFSRKGNHFKGEIRADGEGEWKTLFEEDAELPAAIHVGPYMTYSPERDPRAFWKIEWDQISFKPQAEKEGGS